MNAFSSFVSARDYEGFGTASAEEVLNLRKALEAGYDRGGGLSGPSGSALGAPGEGAALRMESLEATLKNTTFEMDEIKLFRTVPKMPATNTSEEFNRLVSYSRGGDQAFDLGWMEEGALPEEEDSQYERAAVLIKYLGVVGRVSHVMNTVRSAHGNPVTLETKNKTMWLLQQLENALFFGDSKLNPLQFDGLYPLIRDGAPGNIIDLRGKTLDEQNLGDVLQLIRDNKGRATDFYSTTGVFNDFSKLVLDKQRTPFGTGQPGVIGSRVNAYQGQHGTLNLHDSIFIRPGGKPSETGLGDPTKVPGAPALGALATTAGAAGSKFTAADAGFYGYRVVARNAKGAAVPVNSGTVEVAADDSVTIPITLGANTRWFEVYRTDKAATAGEVDFTTAKLMIKVPAGGGPTLNVVDLNDDLPGLGTAFVLMQNDRSFQWSQLLPMTRIPLATIDTSIRWAQVLYGALKMYTPAKNVVIKNIGRAEGSLTA